MGLDAILAPIQEEMRETEERLYKDISSQDKHLADLVLHISKIKGKRFRPALLLLAGKCSGTFVRQHIDLGIVVELIHTATLVHDDIIDEAVVRRHVETINAKWGREISILFGDYLFSRAYTILSSLDSQIATLIVSQTINILCEGEIVQLLKRHNLDVSESEYLSIIERKTAALCAASCKLGAIFSGANKKLSEALGNYGLKLGVAFQIIDDCLDVTGKEEEVGKTLNTDLQTGKLTLPLIRLVNVLPANRKESVCELIFQNNGNNTKAAIVDLLEEHDAMEYAYESAKQLVKKAQDDISFIPDSPSKTALLELGDYVIERNR
ncbi:MAG: polyprenyl synthetase family protein [Candidatus Scalindua sp. AMX11]|nr:MAG: polyprenyl synthetase family protein [Candidatus Scalindua sp.]NOG82257.1 polyprenyl synthetase family protein [Planctomycetota bacterium]RZV71452.1 MAG: polyprenyl synthetase family protein [Candidatus Scalindua sp. SCAELEC01]TDE64284.1 MAG: polyprenyl synthetase family protein [Candidatus Scalindua sp. AMX11]GJQ59923.1 MAG: polyprenyl synthetase [Candidatus Scalindua sp.]